MRGERLNLFKEGGRDLLQPAIVAPGSCLWCLDPFNLSPKCLDPLPQRDG